MTGGSIHTSLGWIGQFERITRWLQRMKQIKIDREFDGDLQQHQDYIYSFFQNCYHLREWLLKSGVVKQIEIEKLFHNNIELKICRDICNGTKHMEINQPSIDKDISIYREYDHFHVPESTNGPHSMVYLNVRAGKYKYDVFSLAEKCFYIWEEFLKNKNLL